MCARRTFWCWIRIWSCILRHVTGTLSNSVPFFWYFKRVVQLMFGTFARFLPVCFWRIFWCSFTWWSQKWRSTCTFLVNLRLGLSFLFHPTDRTCQIANTLQSPELLSDWMRLSVFPSYEAKRTSKRCHFLVENGMYSPVRHIWSADDSWQLAKCVVTTSCQRRAPTYQ